MKARNILICIVGSLLLPLYLVSCGEDRWTAYAKETATTRWIFDTMRVHYYWNEEMPDFDHANFFQTPANFFKSLLSSEDKFSTINSLTSSTRASLQDASYSYGFDFQLVSLKGKTYAHVLYTLSGSPAEEAMLQRGSWIASINGEEVSQENYTRLYSGPVSKIRIGQYDARGDSVVLQPDLVTLPAARAVDDNPLLSVGYTILNGKPLGYLAYNHFTAGPTTGSDAYNRQLLQASAEWAQHGVKEMILDLRYNTGGAVSCANLLCTILAPATALGDTLGTLVFNANYRPHEQKLMLDPELLQGIGSNLDLDHLYVLTGTYTASASEMVINCLSPFMDVILIGQKTVGKNMGSLTFRNEERMIEMHPLVCRLYNSLWESDYSSGFTPQYTLDENSDLAHFYPLGNVDEPLLAKALELIFGSSDPSATTRAPSATFTPLTTGSTFCRSRELLIDK